MGPTARLQQEAAGGGDGVRDGGGGALPTHLPCRTVNKKLWLLKAALRSLLSLALAIAARESQRGSTAEVWRRELQRAKAEGKYATGATGAPLAAPRNRRASRIIAGRPE